MKEKEFLLRETRKLLSILDNYGNALVPPIEGQKETTALEKLKHNTNILMEEFNLSLDEIQSEINTLKDK